MRPLEDVNFDLLDGAAIAFERLDPYPEGHHSGFYVVDGSARVSKNGWRVLRAAPALSPDGRRVAFLEPPEHFDSESAWDLAVADVDSLNATRVVRLPSNAEGPPRWTHDARLLFAVDEGFVAEGRRTSIYVQDAAAGATREVVHRFFWPSGQSLTCPWLDHGYAEPPSIAPNGDIAFMCNWLALHVIDRASDSVRTIYTIPGTSTGDRRLLYAPAMSPDGRAVFLVEAPQTGKPDSLGIQLRLVNSDGTGMRVLATMSYGPWGEFAGHSTFSSCWLSANRIAFTVPDGHLLGHVYVISTTGGNPTRLTTKADAADRSVSCARR